MLGINEQYMREICRIAGRAYRLKFTSMTIDPEGKHLTATFVRDDQTVTVQVDRADVAKGLLRALKDRLNETTT